MGTRINDVQLIKVVDGDSLRVQLDGDSTALRLIGVDTEESNPGDKPVTNAGTGASNWARKFFLNPDGTLPTVDIEFDTDEPIAQCLDKYRGTHGRLICYVHFKGENYNILAVRRGWSPYFTKYGYSRLYHRKFLEAEATAQAAGLRIWDKSTNSGGESRDYEFLLPWWNSRGAAVELFRRLSGAFSVRHDYHSICAAADAEREITVFCDLRRGVSRWHKHSAVLYAGTRFHPFNLYLPESREEPGASIVRLVEQRYKGTGRGYVYVHGRASRHEGMPQIVLTSPDQLFDWPE